PSPSCRSPLASKLPFPTPGRGSVTTSADSRSGNLRWGGRMSTQATGRSSSRAEATDRQVRRLRLPDRFYLPRRLANGLKVRDVMPWRGAVEYVSDGRIGMRMQDGEVLWITERQESLLSAFREEFDGVDV